MSLNVDDAFFYDWLTSLVFKGLDSVFRFDWILLVYSSWNDIRKLNLQKNKENIVL